MNITSDVLAPFIGLNGFGNKPAGSGGTGLSTLAENYSSSKLSWQEQRSTDLTLVTGDGDRVTLSSSTDRQASFEVYNSSGAINGTSTSAHMESFSLSSGRSMSISVEGELSEQEMADIALVASSVDKMATKFFSGDVDEALASVLDAGATGSGTISSISASMSHTRSFSFTHQQSVAQPPETPPLPADGSTPTQDPALTPSTGTNPTATPQAGAVSTAAGVVNSNNTPAPTQTAAAPTQGGTNPQAPVVTPLPADGSTPPQEPGVITLDSTLGFINELSSTVEGMGIDLGKIEEELFELMGELFEEIAEEQDPAKAMDKLVHFVKDEFLHELKEIIEDVFDHDDDDEHDDDHHDDHHKVDGGHHGHGADHVDDDDHDGGHHGRGHHDDDDHHLTAPAAQQPLTQPATEPAPTVAATTQVAVTQPAATQQPAPQVDAAGSAAQETQPIAGSSI